MTSLLKQYEPLLSKASHQSHLLTIAEDAFAEAQEVFVRVVYRYDMSSGVPFAGFAKRIVYGRMRTLFRQARQNWQWEVLPKNYDSDEDEGDFWMTIADGHDDIGSLVDHEFLRTALDKLTPRQREVIDLLYFQDMNQADVASKLGISQQAVAKLKGKAIKAMRNS